MVIGISPYSYYNNVAMQLYYGSRLLDAIGRAFPSNVSSPSRNTSIYTSAYERIGSTLRGGGQLPSFSDTKVGNLLTSTPQSSTGSYYSCYGGTPMEMITMPDFPDSSKTSFLPSMEPRIPSPGEVANYVGLMLSAPQNGWRGNPANNPPYGSDLNALPTITENGYGPSMIELFYQRGLTSQNNTAKQISKKNTQQKVDNNKPLNATDNKTTNPAPRNSYNMTNTVMPDNGNEKLNNIITKRAEKAISVTEYDKYINKYAKMYGVDPLLVKSVISQESNWKTDGNSSKGAKGLMQLMPATAAAYGCTDSSDPEQNIKAGIQYLAYLLDRYDNNAQCALAAYNGGPSNVDDILNGTNNNGKNPDKIKDPSGIPRFKETQDFVYIVLGIYNKLIS